MRRSTAFTAAFAVVALSIVAARLVWAADPVKIQDFPPIQGYLGDQLPDGPWWEGYDNRAAKFYGATFVDLGQDEAIVVDVCSYEYQPALFIQDHMYRSVENGAWRSGALAPYFDQQAQRLVYCARLDFTSTASGRSKYLITHSTGALMQGGDVMGGFTITASTWRMPASPGGGGGGDPPSEYACECVHSDGRRFASDVYGGCNPDLTPHWCDP